MIRKSAPGRLSFWIKYGSFIIITWFFIHTYFTFRNDELQTTYIAANRGIEEIQNKIAELIQRNAIDNDHDDEFNENAENDNRQKIEKLEMEEERPLELDDGITPEMKEIIRRLGLVNPGMNGEAVPLPKNLSQDLQEMKDRGYKSHAYNTFVSAMIGLNRHLPDARSDECIAMKYRDNLPKCSIIIIFHNEDWFALMRTVHSILRNSPLELIEEILLVDDASDMGKVYL